MKRCTRCEEDKEATPENFTWRSKTQGKLHSWCKLCTAEYNKEYAQRNRKKLSENQREWRKANRESVRETQARYREANRDAVNEHAARYREANREALAAKQRDYYHQNPEAYYGRARARQLKHEYGLSVEQYQAMLDAQGGVCWICENPPGEKSLHVDHDHDTGQIRGLLCMFCNNALGRFGDNVEGLQRAIYYMTSAAERMREAMPGGTAFEPRSKRYEARPVAWPSGTESSND